MRQRFLGFRDYADLEAAVRRATRSYGQTGDRRVLRPAVRYLEGLFKVRQRNEEYVPVVTVIEGWLSRAGGFSLRARDLERWNPHHEIRLRRHVRQDAPKRFWANGVQLGFRVEMRSFANSEILFAAGHPSGLSPLRFSNLAAKEQSLYLAPIPAERRATGDVLGYIDRMAQWPRWNDLAARWFSQLTLENAREMTILADASMLSPQLESAIREELSASAFSARWRDRMALSTIGRAHEFRSALVPLDIVRPIPDAESGPSVDLPRMVRTRTHHRASPTGVRLPVPGTDVLVVEDADVQDGGTVISGERLVVYERASDPVLDLVAGQWETVFGSPRNPDLALVEFRERSHDRLPEALLLSGRNDFNWFHWMVEYLPRIILAEGRVAPEIPALISDRVPPSGVEALRNLTDRPIVTVDASLRTPVDRLHVIAPPVQIFDTSLIPWAEGLRVNPEPLHELRRRWEVDTPIPGRGRRVFVRRASRHRGLANEARLASIAEAHGFELVDPSAMSWSEQHELFSSTEFLVGASGAVMANYLLMRPGSRVLALTSDVLIDFILPAVLAQISGVEFRYLDGQPTVELKNVNHRSEWIHSDYKIRPAVFRGALAQLTR